jgi:hypothetical protein
VESDPEHLKFLIIRGVHIASMAVLLGGAILLWAASFSLKSQKAGDDVHLFLFLAGRYEWIAWGAIWLLVFTGVGNLAAFGESLPQRSSDWGTKLGIKLFLVIAFIAFSLVRTAFVARLDTLKDTSMLEISRRGQARLGGLYAATTLFLIVTVGLAVSLAHG